MAELPAYQAIKDHILARIDSGEWGEGSLIPSENELARQFNVARMTVNRALRELTDAQVLTRTKGAGTYVAPPKYQSTLVQLRNIADEIAARGHGHRGELQRLERCKADAAAFFASLEALVRRHVGLPLVWLGEIERDDLVGGLTQPSVPPTARAASAAFMRRIDGLSRSARGPRA